MTTELMGNENEYLLEVNCFPHILHNAVKYTIEKKLFGFKSCITKVFNYFMFIHQKEFQKYEKYFALPTFNMLKH